MHVEIILLETQEEAGAFASGILKMDFKGRWSL